VVRLVKFGEFRKGMEGLFNMIKVLIYSTYYSHPKPHLAFNIPVNPDVYPSGINIPKHFTIILYSKGKELPQEDVFATFWRSLESII